MDNQNQAFQGTGWGFPPTFRAGGAYVDMVAGQEGIEQSLKILLATTIGERPMLLNYGCNLQGYVFEEMSQTLLNQINSTITNAILYYEARINLNKVNIDTSKQTEGLLNIEIDYTIRSSNSRFNMVYPFYLNENNNPGF